MFLKNLRQRIVQYYIKIEPCHAKVFRPTMVQRHIRDRANADSAVCTQTMLYMSAQSPSPWTFLTNLRQRIVQYYTKIEPGYAKVFRPTMVQRHIREWPDTPTVARQWPDSTRQGPTPRQSGLKGPLDLCPGTAGPVSWDRRTCVLCLCTIVGLNTFA